MSRSWLCDGEERTVNFTAEIPATIIQHQLDDVLRESASAARGVPSSDAWSWRATDALIELLVDPWLGADPRQRTVLLDAGAGLQNLRVLIKGRGVHPAVRLHPDPARPDLVATVRLEGRRSGPLRDGLRRGTGPGCAKTRRREVSPQ